MTNKCIVADLLGLALSQAGLAVHTAPEVGPAIQYAKAHRPHVILIETPEEKGQQTTDYFTGCTAIRRVLPEARLVHLWPDKSPQSLYAALVALKAHQVDDFLYHDTPLSYMISLFKNNKPGGPT